MAFLTSAGWEAMAARMEVRMASASALEKSSVVSLAKAPKRSSHNVNLVVAFISRMRSSLWKCCRRLASNARAEHDDRTFHGAVSLAIISLRICNEAVQCSIEVADSSVKRLVTQGASQERSQQDDNSALNALDQCVSSSFPISETRKAVDFDRARNIVITAETM